MRISIEEEIDVKRFYIPEVKATCPECGHECSSDDYLSYPCVGDKLHYYCGECEHEWYPYKIEAITIDLEDA